MSHANSRQSLILNSPFVEPALHWGAPTADGSLALIEGRRPASYDIFDPRNQTRRQVMLDEVNEIRKRVADWRKAQYPGITSMTRRLLEHWHDQTARPRPFYFCQLEAIEALIWHVEGAAEFKQGVNLKGDGGEWERLCSKMATGSGKTTVMAMVITWQVLNALAYPKHKSFSKALFIVTPGLTVKERLQVLMPGHGANYYDEFKLCPSDSLREKINQADLLIENWHALMPLKEAERSVVKKGAESDEAFTRRVLGKLAQAKDLVIINDEAHHAYRQSPDDKRSKEMKKSAEALGLDQEEATRWIEGLDRIHKTRRIRRCFDLSATPFAPTGKKNTEEALFPWILSDFGLNDAIEAGLVKTPRVVIRDSAVPDAQTMKSKLYHLYNHDEVREDLNRKAEAHEPLPDLVAKAYTLLAADWQEAQKNWKEAGHKSPPVMLSVVNRIETAARVENHFLKGDCPIPGTKAPTRTLRVDSKILEKAELGETASADKDYEKRLNEILDAADIPEARKAKAREVKKEELLREIVDTVGKPGQPGQDLQNVVSVAMLSEGWDAKNVTHIMGLRAFTSQLLCEQVIGRGLRRVAYDVDENGLFRPEFVNVFGVPLAVFQDVEGGGEAPPPPKPSTQIEVLPERGNLEIKWPNILRVDTVLQSVLKVDWDKIPAIELDPAHTPISAEIAPQIGGHENLAQLTDIDLVAKADDLFRLQSMVFQAARKAFDQLPPGQFRGDRGHLAFQLIRLAEQLLASDKIKISGVWFQDPRRRRVLLAMNMERIVQVMVQHLHQENRERLEPVFDPENPLGSTGRMNTWYTTKPCHPSKRSQISHVVFDSAWEACEAYALDHSDAVAAYAKNDHLNFVIHYFYRGAVRKFFPDYLVRLANGKTLVLEVKGEDSDQNKAKREALAQWVDAVNAKGGFGEWAWDVSFAPADVQDILQKHAV